MNKFKPGDKVRCIAKCFSNETVGKVYTIKEFFPEDSLSIQIEVDDLGYPNSYHESQFELAYISEFNEEWKRLTS